MESTIAVVEWSPGSARAYNPATRQTASGASIAEALRKVGSPVSVGLCLGRRASFVRESRVPDVDKSDLRTIVLMQLENLFPAVQTELAFDFCKGTKSFDDGVQLMVCAAQSDVVRRALAEAQEAGAKVAWIAPAALGSAAVAHAQGHDDAVVAELVDGVLNLDVVRYGLLVYSRSAVDPGDVDGRTAEVQRTLAAYGMAAAAVVAVEGTPLGNDVRRSADGPLQAMAHHNPATLDIELPEVVASKIKRSSQSRVRFAAILWLMALAYGGFVYFDRTDAADRIAATVSKEARERQALQKEIDKLDAQAKTAQADQKKLAQALAPSQRISDVLTLVANSTPQDVWLTGITFERAKPLQLRGTAMTSEAVTQYTARLAMEDRLRDVQLLFANNSDIEEKPVVQFAITAHVVGNLPLLEDTHKRGAGK